MMGPNELGGNFIHDAPLELPANSDKKTDTKLNGIEEEDEDQEELKEEDIMD
jgi:hypothetical protein